MNRALRLNRRNNKGLMVDTRTGLTAHNRRRFIQRATSITASTFPLTVATVRKRYQRYGWLLQDAIATPAPSQ